MNDSLKIETSYWSAIPLDPKELFEFAVEATDEIERLHEENRKLKERITELGWITSPERMGQ